MDRVEANQYLGEIMSTKELAQIIQRDGTNRCHYCNIITSRNSKTGRRATRDHVVPKSMGGADRVYNFVLACESCNSIRGNILHYCYCDFCINVVDSWISDNLWSFANFNRVKIFKAGNYWATLHKGKRRYHDTFQGAVKSVKGQINPIRKHFGSSVV